MFSSWLDVSKRFSFSTSMADSWNTDTGEAVFRTRDAVKNLKIKWVTFLIIHSCYSNSSVLVISVFVFVGTSHLDVLCSLRVRVERVTSTASLSQHLQQQVLSQQDGGAIEMDTLNSLGQTGTSICSAARVLNLFYFECTVVVVVCFFNPSTGFEMMHSTRW